MPPRVLKRFLQEALALPSDIILVTGPTGSGKTTTLYGCVAHLNDDEQSSVVTAEDPVEYVVDGIAECSINPQINLTYEETLRHMVRQDPDVIVLGEIRDRFSAETAIRAALTGRKVLTTFHTEGTIGGLLRLMNMDIESSSSRRSCRRSRSGWCGASAATARSRTRRMRRNCSGSPCAPRRAGHSGESDCAFLGGPLHDIGKLLVLTWRASTAGSPSRRPSSRRSSTPCTRSRAPRCWRTGTCRKCTCASRATIIATRRTRPIPCMAIVRLVDLACRRLGVDGTPDPDAVLFASREAEALGLSEVQLAELEIAIEDAQGLEPA